MTGRAGDPLSAALAHLAAGRAAQARSMLLRAVARAPRDPAINDALAAACLAEGDPARAAYYAQRAIAERPESAQFLTRLGTALAGATRYAEAEAALRRALAIDQNNPEARFALTSACFAAGQFAVAENEARAARAAAPGDRELAVRHAAALLHLGRADESVAVLRSLLLAAPDDAVLTEGLCTIANYAAGLSAQQVFGVHQQLARILADQDAPPPLCAPGAGRRTAQGERLRVGILSPDLHEHSVAYFAGALLRHHDRSMFEIAVFDTGHPGHADGTTAALRSAASEWHEVYADAPLGLAHFIHRRRIDVLIDLSGLTAGHRLHTLRFRPAPVQVTWCGYPASTGCAFIDARIVDSHTDPAGSLAAERLVRIDPCFLAYTPPGQLGPSPAHGPPAQPGRAPAFGSFNALTKVTDRTLALWGAVLRASEGSTLVLKNRECRSPDVRDALRARLSAAGIDPARVEILPPTATTREHLECYHRVDVALDTFPYHGTTTTCEALCCGVPVVSLIGDRHASRVGLTLLSAAGAADWATSDEATFVARALALGEAARRGTADRPALADRIRRSPLCDGPAFTERMGRALLELTAGR